MLARGGDTVQLIGQFQAGDEAHVIIGQNGADQAIGQGSFDGAFPLPEAPQAYTRTSAWMYVKRGSQHSNLISFSYAPPMQQTLLGPPLYTLAPTSTIAGFGADWDVIQNTNPNDGTDMLGRSKTPMKVEHRGGFFGGNKGDDAWVTAPLNEGWYIVSVDLDCMGASCTFGNSSDNNGIGGGSTIAEPFVPGTVLPFKIHWWVDANGYSAYTVRSILMIGPAGTFPFR
jgi:hypothetical protein